MQAERRWTERQQQGDFLALVMEWLTYLYIRNPPKAMMANPAMPPTTPPTMAGTADGLEGSDGRLGETRNGVGISEK